MFLMCAFFVGCSFQVLAAANAHIPCDLDLVQIDRTIADYLPDECKGIEIGSHIYNRMLQESQLFQKYDDELNAYETSQDVAYVPAEDVVPEKLWALRFRLHEESAATGCVNTTEQVTYLECLATKRLAMITLLGAQRGLISK